MTINADALLNQTMLNALSNVPKALTSATDFQTELQRQLIDNLKAKEEATTVKTDAAVEDFKRQFTSMGAASYLQEQNTKKIEELLEKKKQELMDSLGLGEKTQPPLSGEARKTALETLDELLSDYKKQLLEEMQAVTKAGTNTTTLSALLEKM